MTTAPALRPCPFCGGHNLQGHPIHLRVECIDCYAEGPEANSRAEAIAAWNARPGGDEAVRTAEDRGYKRAAKMIAALVADAMIYEDSYGVVGSEFPCCMACNAGGAPGINFTHQANCVVLKCETIADDLWQEQRDELNFVNEENERLRAELAALKGASHDQSRATGSTGAAL